MLVSTVVEGIPVIYEWKPSTCTRVLFGHTEQNCLLATTEPFVAQTGAASQAVDRQNQSIVHQPVDVVNQARHSVAISSLISKDAEHGLNTKVGSSEVATGCVEESEIGHNAEVSCNQERLLCDSSDDPGIPTFANEMHGGQNNTDNMISRGSVHEFGIETLIVMKGDTSRQKNAETKALVYRGLR